MTSFPIRHTDLLSRWQSLQTQVRDLDPRLTHLRLAWQDYAQGKDEPAEYLADGELLVSSMGRLCRVLRVDHVIHNADTSPSKVSRPQGNRTILYQERVRYDAARRNTSSSDLSATPQYQRDTRGSSTPTRSPKDTPTRATRYGANTTSPYALQQARTGYRDGQIDQIISPDRRSQAGSGQAAAGLGQRHGLPVTPRNARQGSSSGTSLSRPSSAFSARMPDQTPTGHGTPSERAARPLSPASSVGSSRSNLPRLANGRRSLIPVASPSASSRRNMSRTGSSPPPVPALPSQASIAEREREIRTTHLRALLQTPEPTLRARATQMPFYSGRRSVSDQIPKTPARAAAGDPFHNRTPGSSGGSRNYAPSAWKEQPVSRQPVSRPGSAMSTRTRAGSATPLPTTRSYKAFVPNPLDPLDMELAHILDSIPHDVHVERLDPPLRKGQRHEGEWRAQYAFTSGRHGRRIYPSRLLELHKPRSNNEKVRKVMVRVDGLWRDVRLVLVEMA